MSLFDALEEGNISEIKRHFSIGADVLAGNGHHTVLHSAVRSNNSEVVKLVLDRIKETRGTVFPYIDALDNETDTPLMWTAECGYLNAALVLLEYGADAEAKNSKGMTALHWAAQRNKMEALKLLISKGSKVDVEDMCGQTPLDYAKQRRNWEIAEELFREVQKNRTKTTEAFTQTEADNAGELFREVQKNRTKTTEAFTQTEADNDFERKMPAAQDRKVLRDYKGLLLNGDGCDVTLQVKGQTFEAHKAILKARSSVFASMFSHDMKEKKTGVIDIVDCDSEWFLDFLCFLYCGSVDSITYQNVCSLYRAADKYDVQDLKSECLTFIKSHLDENNFCDVITLALQHSEADLLRQATDFFTQNSLKIVLTVKWQVFLDENPTQSNELLVKAFSGN